MTWHLNLSVTRNEILHTMTLIRKQPRWVTVFISVNLDKAVILNIVQTLSQLRQSHLGYIIRAKIICGTSEALVIGKQWLSVKLLLLFPHNYFIPHLGLL